MIGSVRRWVAGATVGLVAIGGVGLSPGVASAGERHSEGAASRVSLTFTKSGAVDVEARHIHPGTVVVDVDNDSTTSRSLVVFSLNGSTTLTKVLQDITADFQGGPAGAAATKALTAEAHFVGGVDVAAGQDLTYTTVALRRGTYYAVDTSTIGGPTDLAKVLGSVKVSGDPRRSDDPDSRVVIRGTSADRFEVSSNTLPANGTVTFRNTSDTIHFMDLQPVAKGTTDAQIQAFFDSGSQTQPPFFVNGPALTAEVVSPGVAEKVSYKLPAGDYVLLCFVTDDMTGAPHAIMGMHKVVHLR